MRTPLVLSIAMSMAACVLVAGAAAAQDEWKDEEGEEIPPDDHPGKKKEVPKPDRDAKPARFVADLKLGPAFVLSSRGVTEFGLQLNFGYALANSLAMKDDALYVTVSPYLITGEDLALVAPLGAQYELPLKMIPYEGISAYARVSVGYLYYKPPLLDFDKGYHGVAVQPALGAKLSFLDRFHVGIEPFAFDVYTVFPPKSTSLPTSTQSAFQLYIFGGARF